MSAEFFLLIIGLILVIFVLITILNFKNRAISDLQSSISLPIMQFQKSISDSITQFEMRIQSLEKVNENLQKTLDNRFSESSRSLISGLDFQMNQFRQSLTDSINQVENRIQSLEKVNATNFEGLKSSLSVSIKDLQNENHRQLDNIRETVEDKLQTTLQRRISESFKNVSERLEQVQFGLGEMKNLADDVGGLKKILSGIKTRGILGEVQLESILQDILSPEQYDKNIATVPNSNCRVEFAIKLPKNGSDDFAYIPIDSKFPLDSYITLQEALESGDKIVIDDTRRRFNKSIMNAAKDINEKYIYPPVTVNFAIMFLPFESLYIEVVTSGLLEELQRKYKISVAGPSTMAAFLNTLRMGYQMFAIQKRSNDVWKVLSVVKTEFEKFESVMIKMQNHLNQTNADLENLIGTRTRAIRRKLNDIELTEDTEK